MRNPVVTLAYVELSEGDVQAHTEACAPSEFLPQTPLPLLQVMLLLESFAPAEGLDVADAGGSLAEEVGGGCSLGANP